MLNQARTVFFLYSHAEAGTILPSDSSFVPDISISTTESGISNFPPEGNPDIISAAIDAGTVAPQISLGNKLSPHAEILTATV